LGVLRAFLLKFLKVGEKWRKMPKLGKTWVKLGESWVVFAWFLTADFRGLTRISGQF
jgi:hypothetical protein